MELYHHLKFNGCISVVLLDSPPLRTWEFALLHFKQPVQKSHKKSCILVLASLKHSDHSFIYSFQLGKFDGTMDVSSIEKDPKIK